jgi:hypothetical protein
MMRGSETGHKKMMVGLGKSMVKRKRMGECRKEMAKKEQEVPITTRS